MAKLRVNRKAPLSAAAKQAVANAKAVQRERAFLAHLSAVGLFIPVPEYRFDRVRRFRFDYAWIDAKVALEVDGGVWTRGAHGRGTGIVRDQEKGNLAASQGWRVFRVTPRQLTDRQTAVMLKTAILGAFAP